MKTYIKPIKKVKEVKSTKEVKEIKYSLRFSIRIAGSATSLSLKRNLVSLWLTLVAEDIDTDLHYVITNFIYSCLGDWKEDTAKGLSDFVSEKMIENILEAEDFVTYREIFDKL